MKIRPFNKLDTEYVVQLWRECGLYKPWNNPYLDIERKETVMPELFLIGEKESEIVASVMAGYDGHRGWVNYLAVHPDQRGHGYARQLMESVEQSLIELGCPKLNLQVRATNLDVIEFYEKLGYAQDECVSLGKRLIADN